MTRLVHVVSLCALTLLSAASARAELQAGERFINVLGGAVYGDFPSSPVTPCRRTAEMTALGVWNAPGTAQ